MIDALGTLAYVQVRTTIFFESLTLEMRERARIRRLIQCIWSNNILEMMRIGQSRVIYSDVEEPLGVVCADDIYIYIYTVQFDYCPKIIILSRRPHHHHHLLLLPPQRLRGHHQT
jgi:hypothetical protein